MSVLQPRKKSGTIFKKFSDSVNFLTEHAKRSQIKHEMSLWVTLWTVTDI